jgi:hypothetical protein
MEKSNCSPGACTNRAQAQEDYRTGNSNATASTISFVAGGALLATGVVLLLTAHDSAAPTQGSLYLAPGTALGPGVALGGEF